jgi:hypothetical protein
MAEPDLIADYLAGSSARLPDPIVDEWPTGWRRPAAATVIAA